MLLVAGGVAASDHCNSMEIEARRPPSVALGLQDFALQSTKCIDNSISAQELGLRGVFVLFSRPAGIGMQRRGYGNDGNT